MSGRLASLHLALGLLLIFLFGASIKSLSIDLPHHFAVVDELMKNGFSSAPHVASMWSYPRLSHWLAAGLGYIVGSGLVAIWLLSITAIYVCYYFASRIATAGAKPVALALFVVLVWLSLPTTALLGFEIVGNFFYSQLIASAAYFAMLSWLGYERNRPYWMDIVIVLAVTTIVLFVHALPALHLLGTLGLFLLLKLSINFASSKTLQPALLMGFLAFATAGLLLLYLHPGVANMREISRNDGALTFGAPTIAVLSVAVCALLLSWYPVWSGIRNDRQVTRADLVVCASLCTALGLAGIQLVALRVFGEGSFYAVGKHFFLVLTLSLIAISRWGGTWFSNQRFPGDPALQMAGAACTAFLATSLVLYSGPKVSLYPIVRSQAYADNAANFTAFQPGNTFITAPSIHPVIRYMLSITAFKGTLAGKPLGLIDGTFVARRDAEFIMTDRIPAVLAKCSERYSETWLYVIVPSSCLGKVPADGLISFDEQSGSSQFLSGWWPQEPWGVWSKDTPGLVTLELPESLRSVPLELAITAQAFVVPDKPSLAVEIAINGKQLSTIYFPLTLQPIVIPVPSELTSGSQLQISFTARNAVSPASVGYNADTRPLGIGLKTLQIRRSDS